MRSTYPPGPRWPAAVQSFLFQRHRAWLLPVMKRRYGDVFALRVPPYDNLVVFNRPEHIKEIFAADPAELHAGEGNQVLGPVMGEHSLLLTDEEEHARARRLARAEIDGWDTSSEVVALDRMNALTLEVIMRVVFGVTDRHTRDQLAPRLHRRRFLAHGRRRRATRDPDPLHPRPASRRATRTRPHVRNITNVPRRHARVVIAPRQGS